MAKKSPEMQAKLDFLYNKFGVNDDLIENRHVRSALSYQIELGYTMEEIEVGHRKCMNCEKIFVSVSKYNRICRVCKKMIEYNKVGSITTD